MCSRSTDAKGGSAMTMRFSTSAYLSSLRLVRVLPLRLRCFGVVVRALVGLRPVHDKDLLRLGFLVVDALSFRLGAFR